MTVAPAACATRSGAVATAVIDDHHLVHELAGYSPDNAPDSGLFIQGWDHRHHAHGPWPFQFAWSTRRRVQARPLLVP